MPDEPDTSDAVDPTDGAGTADADGWLDESLEETWLPPVQDEPVADAATQIADEVAGDFPEAGPGTPETSTGSEETDEEAPELVDDVEGMHAEPDDQVAEVHAVDSVAGPDDAPDGGATDSEVADETPGDVASDSVTESDGAPGEVVTESDEAPGDVVADSGAEPAETSEGAKAQDVVLSEDEPGVPTGEVSDEEVDAAPDEPAPEARAPYEPTGHPAVDAVLSSLEGLEQRPVGEHVAVFEQAHAGLRQALDDGHAS
jgi:hypothetical protein